jgi:hypothetical protein
MNMTVFVDGHRLGGCLFMAEPPAAPVVAPVSDAPHLPVVDLRPGMTPVDNQWNTGSCAANAVVGALEYYLAQGLASRGVPVDQVLAASELSRLFVYYNARQLADKTDEDCGTFIFHVMAAVMAHGACSEASWPYIESNFAIKPPQVCYDEARMVDMGTSQLTTGLTYARTTLGIAAFATLTAGIPVVFGANFPGSFFQQAAKTGRMPSVAETGPPPPGDGGHAMLIVGYDLNDRTWLIRNSWGADWADGGHCRIPFDTMEACGMPLEYWAIGSKAQFDAARLTVGGVTLEEAAVRARQQGPQQVSDALSRLKSGLRTKINEDLATAKKGFRDRLRGPGLGGGY